MFGLGSDYSLIVALILLNLVLAVIGALRQGTFEFAKLGGFCFSKVLPYGGGYLIMGYIAKLAPEVAAAQGITLAAITLALLADLWANLRGLGIPLPPVPAIKREDG